MELWDSKMSLIHQSTTSSTSSSSSITSELSIDQISETNLTRRNSTNSESEYDDKIVHTNLLTTEETDQIKRDFVLHSWLEQRQLENYFLDDKVC